MTHSRGEGHTVGRLIWTFLYVCRCIASLAVISVRSGQCKDPYEVRTPIPPSSNLGQELSQKGGECEAGKAAIPQREEEGGTAIAGRRCAPFYALHLCLSTLGASTLL